MSSSGGAAFSPDPVHLGSTIRRARVKRRMSQEDLAESTKLTMQFLSRVERGDGHPKLSTLLRIASTLGVSADGLLTSEVTTRSGWKPDSLSPALRMLRRKLLRAPPGVVDEILRFLRRVMEVQEKRSATNPSGTNPSGSADG